MDGWIYICIHLCLWVCLFACVFVCLQRPTHTHTYRYTNCTFNVIPGLLIHIVRVEWDVVTMLGEVIVLRKENVLIAYYISEIDFPCGYHQTDY